MGGNHRKKNFEFATTKSRLCHTDFKIAIFPLSRATGTKPSMKVVKRFSPCHMPAVGFKEDIFSHKHSHTQARNPCSSESSSRPCIDILVQNTDGTQVWEQQGAKLDNLLVICSFINWEKVLWLFFTYISPLGQAQNNSWGDGYEIRPRCKCESCQSFLLLSCRHLPQWLYWQPESANVYQVVHRN